MPLYPGMRPPCDPSPCMKVRLFDDCCRGDHHLPPMQACERVVIDNPCRQGERAEVALGVDDCGNLVVCVHRVSDWCDRRTGATADRCRTGCDRDDRCRRCDREVCCRPEPRPCPQWPDCRRPCRPRRRCVFG